MNEALINLINLEFAPEEVDAAIEAMNTVTLKHVMADSEYNPNNTYYALLKLSKGNLAELKKLVECARIDFRDVIYWATLE